MRCRKVALALAAVAAVSASAEAQMTNGMRTVSFGIMGGVNFANVMGDDAEDTGNRTGVNIGAYVDLPVGGPVSIRPELLYSMEGASADDLDAKIELNYIRVPVLVRFTGGTPGGTRPFFAIGPSFGIQVGCELSAEDGGVSGSIDCDELTDEPKIEFPEKKTFDISGKAEAGLDFAVGERVFTAGASYSHGFTKLFEDLDIKNRVFAVFFGFGF